MTKEQAAVKERKATFWGLVLGTIMSILSISEVRYAIFTFINNIIK